MKKNVITMLYAIMLGVICAAIPTAVVMYTAPLRDANAKAEEIRNIFEVLEIKFDKHAKSADLVSQFGTDVKTETFGSTRVYVKPEGADSAKRIVAVPFSGRGIWGPIKGFLSLEADYTTIHGISFYQQEETPGLGGEISSAQFRAKFRGKSIVDAAGKPGFHIRRNGAHEQNVIDGISGATLTCKKVDALVNDLATHFYEERTHVR